MVGKILVRMVEKIKQITGLYTYQVEYAFVFLVLFVTAVINKADFIEWIGAAAVLVSFMHAKVANRLAEREKFRQQNSDEIILSYHYKIGRFFILKEILWFAYFILLGAWSALVGVIIFLLYEPWRKLWRKYFPLLEKIEKEKLRKVSKPRNAENSGQQ